ncbi:MAG: transcriptional regulator [Pseudomonas piscis]|uniref:transcriptional regulator n=1 Tax=Pseudomonas piscis TaxID=2614538 RepID=UPI003D2AA179
MSLHTYMKSLDKLQVEDLASRCKTTMGQLKQIAYGNRRASGGLAVNLERETKGAVTCEELRPDIDWAYLRGSKAA